MPLNENHAKYVEYYKTKVFESFYACLPEIRDCEIISKNCIPEGIKPHTRSIAWLAEQVVNQAIRRHIRKTHFETFLDVESDIGLGDCIGVIDGISILLNIKVTASNKNNKNDMNKAYKIYELFKRVPEALFFYVVLKIEFVDNYVEFSDTPPTILYAPYVNEIYVNKSNHHLQAKYHEPMVIRSVSEFTDEVIKQIREKGIKEK